MWAISLNLRMLYIDVLYAIINNFLKPMHRENAYEEHLSGFSSFSAESLLRV